MGPAVAGIGVEGDVAGGVLFGDEAAVEQGVGVGEGDALFCGDGVGGVVVVPEVVESVGGGDGVDFGLAAVFGGGTVEPAFGAEVGIAVVGSLFAVTGGEAHFDCLTVVGRHVESQGGPVFPHVLVCCVGVPSQRGAGSEVGPAADGVYDIAAIVAYLHREVGLVG